MSYTPPASNAADFTFSGVAYSSPPADGANFTWDVLAVTKTATGFLATQFGSPTSAYWQIQTATGIVHTNFGTPSNGRTQASTGATPSTTFGTPKSARAGTASGFQSFNSGTATSKIDWQVTQFGTPRLFPFHVAPGYVITQFGTPYATSIKRVTSLGIVTNFGTPTSPTNRTFIAKGASTTQFGYPWGIFYQPPNLTQTQQAYGWTQTQFGTPHAAPEQFGTATGFMSGAFGTPTARRGQQATGFTSTVFGTPKLSMAAHHAGFKVTQFGTPRARRTQHATSIQSTLRWGTPLAVRSNTYLATGTCSTRFGHPTCFSRFNKHATGFSSTTFGTPTMRQTHLVTMIPPGTVFGAPLLKRVLQC